MPRPVTRRISPCAVLALLVTAAIGCGFPAAGPVPPPITPADADAAQTRFPNTSKATLDTGRDLFAARCNGCHNYPDVWKIDDARWPEILSRMGKKAGLDETQNRVVLSFILVARSHPAPP
jgi:cytochrome c5